MPHQIWPSRVAQLNLIAPADVGQLADELADFLREAPSTIDDYEAAKYIEQRGQLCDAMRAELGEPALAPGESARPAINGLNQPCEPRRRTD